MLIRSTFLPFEIKELVSPNIFKNGFEELNSFEQLTDPTFGFTADIPSRYSFEKWERITEKRRSTNGFAKRERCAPGHYCRPMPRYKIGSYGQRVSF